MSLNNNLAKWDQSTRQVETTEQPSPKLLEEKNQEESLVQAPVPPNLDPMEIDKTPVVDQEVFPQEMQKQKTKIDHSQANAKAGNEKRAANFALKSAKNNPNSRKLGNLEKQIHALRRFERIKNGSLEAKYGEKIQGDALKKTRGSASIKFTERTHTILGRTLINHEANQVRAFHDILSKVRQSVEQNYLMYVQDEKAFMESKGLDSEGCENKKGVCVSQILQNSLLETLWAKEMIKRKPEVGREALSLLLDIQIAETKPRQTRAQNFLNTHMSSLDQMIEVIVQKQNDAIDEGILDETTLKMLGLPCDDEEEMAKLLEILEKGSEHALYYDEGALINANSFFKKWSERLDNSIKVWEAAQTSPRPVVTRQLHSYKARIAAVEKKMEQCQKKIAHFGSKGDLNDQIKRS